MRLLTVPRCTTAPLQPTAFRELLVQASKEKSKVKLAACDPGDAKSIALLPTKLRELIARSTKLQAEVRRLDATMHAPAPLKIAVGNPVERQLGLLRAAFEQNRI